MIHIVQSGETVYSIAGAYGVSPASVIAGNDLRAPYAVTPGQALLILIPASVYVTAEGDSLYSISARSGVSENEILQYNPTLFGNREIYPGQTLVLSYTEEKKGNLSFNGYAYPFIEDFLLRSVMPYLAAATVFTYGFRADGSLIPPAENRIPQTAEEYGSSAIIELATLTEDDRFDSSLSTALFASEEAQTKLISALAAELSSKGYQGVELDLEYIPSSERESYVRFTERLAETLRPLGYTVSVALAPKTYDEQPGLLYEGHDYEGLGRAADGVLLMTYEWGYAYGPPQAIAPITKVREVLSFAVTKIPPEKIFLGFPNYAYDWTLPYAPGNPPARTISNVDAAALAAEKEVPILYDVEAQSPYFRYTDDAGKDHIVWFEDVRSAAQKLALIPEYALRGMGIWTVMRRFPQFFLLAAAGYTLR